ncbi:hypothetical protein [Leptothoe kymatousa]|uniref:Uncharacterized protein n=1 Tax=Leptothoe kymatousa TAU-MAC 1615 TaxID=2364775 RepID=A0ABS5Y1E3_9CYAN|nr:hypothetical protein [Leptothoe kymatousa]MBT9311652.1 hypothetical protein [Leptothoe kymatousa TAU-MAC 1615]
MAASPSRLPLDRAVRYAVSDALASVRSHMYDLEYAQRRSKQELAAWNNYLAELRALHQLLLNLPSLETAEWLTDDQADYAPTFTPFVNRLSDAKTNIRRVHNWLLSLPNAASVMGESSLNSVAFEQQHYMGQIDHALTQLQLLPVPGSDEWHSKYQPVIPTAVSAAKSPALVSAVA